MNSPRHSIDNSQDPCKKSRKTIRKHTLPISSHLQAASLMNIRDYLKDINHFSMFECSTKYILEDLNSIAFYDNKIYNLMKTKPKGQKGVNASCKCPKSKCQSKYCVCFSYGKACSDNCQCLNCQNLDQQKHSRQLKFQVQSSGGCKCSKSECMKNYCECFHNGESCSLKCKCSNCRNYL